RNAGTAVVGWSFVPSPGEHGMAMGSAPHPEASAPGHRLRLRRRSVRTNDLERFHIPGEEAGQRCDQRRPAGLVAGANAGTVVAAEILVEQHKVAPVGIVLDLLGSTIDRSAPGFVAQEDALEPQGQLTRHLMERGLLPRSGR